MASKVEETLIDKTKGLAKAIVYLDWVRALFFKLGGRKFVLSGLGVVAVVYLAKTGKELNSEHIADIVDKAINILGVIAGIGAGIWGISREEVAMHDNGINTATGEPHDPS